MKSKTILGVFLKRPYQILSLSRKDEMTNIGLTFKGQHLTKAKNPQCFLALEESLDFFSLCQMLFFNYKSDFMDFVFSAE